MRLGVWAWLVGLPACQLVAGITDVSSNGPCTDDRECPMTESCIEGRCQTKSTSGGAGSGAQGGASGTGGDAGTMGGGRGGSSASGGGSGTSQAGATTAQGGDDGGVSGGSSVAGDSGDGGDGETSGAGGVSGGAGSGGVAGGGTGNGGASGAGAAGDAADGGGGMTAGSSGMAGASGAGPIRIMPLGDGITASTCMRAFLWDMLREGDYPAFDFVGSRLSADTCSPTDYDKDNEGHNGYRVSDVLSETPQHTAPDGDPYTGSSVDLDSWFEERPADIVLMLFGSNDFLSTSYSAANVRSAYYAILTKLRSVNPRVTLLVGLLPPMSSNQCNSNCASRRLELNATIPSWAEGVSTTDSPVVVVDLTDFNVTDTTDGVKPNDAGAQFLAEKWYGALISL